MTVYTKLLSVIIFVFFVAAPTLAQNSDNPFQLKRGDNEFGFWGGVSPKATTIFGGLHDDEAAEATGIQHENVRGPDYYH